MKRKLLFELINGFNIGIVIGIFCSIFFSFIFSNPFYSPVPPEFEAKFNNQLIACIVAVISWGVIGLMFTATSFIFRFTDWSITKMTIVHAGISYVLFLPFAFYLEWIRFDFTGLTSITISYVMIYIILWLIFMHIAKREIKALNKHLK